MFVVELERAIGIDDEDRRRQMIRKLSHQDQLNRLLHHATTPPTPTRHTHQKTLTPDNARGNLATHRLRCRLRSRQRHRRARPPADTSPRIGVRVEGRPEDRPERAGGCSLVGGPTGQQTCKCAGSNMLRAKA